jgi:hypothetical protein
MKLDNVTATVALQRMYIYAHVLNVCEKDNLAHTLLSGHAVTYGAYDSEGTFIGRTRITPEQFPVLTVTEEMF